MGQWPNIYLNIVKIFDRTDMIGMEISLMLLHPGHTCQHLYTCFLLVFQDVYIELLDISENSDCIDLKILWSDDKAQFTCDKDRRSTSRHFYLILLTSDSVFSEGGRDLNIVKIFDLNLSF